jgi:hypothetical protein
MFACKSRLTMIAELPFPTYCKPGRDTVQKRTVGRFVVKPGSRYCRLLVLRQSRFPRKSFISLAQAMKLQYADGVVGGVSPPHPLSVAPVAVQFLAMEGWRMTRKSTLASLVVAVVLSLCLTACKDTKTLQENDQLKAQVADLQKQNGELGNNLETVTAARDALIKENDSLKAQIQARKPKKAKKKTSSRKRRQG